MLLMVEQLLTDMLFYILKKCVLFKSIKETYRQQGRIQGGGGPTGARPPKIGKNMIFLA